MINKIDKLVRLFKQLNEVSGLDLITDKELNNAAENITDFKADFCRFISLVEDKKNIKSDSEAKTLIAHLYRYCGDVLQDIENIHELLTIIAQRYNGLLEQEAKSNIN